MTTGILIIAHAPLATALREGALHVFPEAAQHILALDVAAQDTPESTCAHVQLLMHALNTSDVLVFTDVYGATPCNAARSVVEGPHAKLVAGVNLPMLIRTVNYLDEPLDALVDRALAGGTQSIMLVHNPHDTSATKTP